MSPWSSVGTESGESDHRRWFGHPLWKCSRVACGRAVCAGSGVLVLGVVKRFVVGRFAVLAGERGRLPLALAAVLSMVLSLAVVTPAPAATVTTPGGFTSVAPSRLLDTRNGTGAPKVAVAKGGVVHLQVAGRGGVPTSGVSAVVLNVTVTAPASGGYVTVYGDVTGRPTASNLNFVKAQTVPNLVVAPVGPNGKVALYNGSTGTVQLIADVSGYYVSGSPAVAGAFGSLAPFRLLDTRIGTGAPKVAVAPGGTVALQVTGRGFVPATGVSAVVLNVTATAPTKPGSLTVYGAGTTRPLANNVNFVARQTVPNLVTAQVGTGGKVSLYNGSAGTVHVIADVSGYYRSGTPGVAGAFGSLPQPRLLDTRTGVGCVQGRGRGWWHGGVAGHRSGQCPGFGCFGGRAERHGCFAHPQRLRHGVQRGGQPPDGVQPELRGGPDDLKHGCRSGRFWRQGRPLQRVYRHRPAHRRCLGMVLEHQCRHRTGLRRERIPVRHLDRAGMDQPDGGVPDRGDDPACRWCDPAGICRRG
jgi:hypothetical protein